MIDLNILDQITAAIQPLEQRALSAESALNAANTRAETAERIIEAVRAAIGGNAVADATEYLGRIHTLETLYQVQTHELDDLRNGIAETAEKYRLWTIRELISELDTNAPNFVSIRDLVIGINRERGFGDDDWPYMSEKKAARVLDDLCARYPGLIERDDTAYRASHQIAPYNDDGQVRDEDISVIYTDWEALLETVWQEMQPAPKARKPRKAAKAPQPVKAAPVTGDAITDDDRAILKGITTEWQTVLQLHRSAQVHGFKMGNQTVRNRMLRHIVVSEHGATIETQASPLAWRLRSPVDPKPTKAKAPANPAPIAEPTPAPKTHVSSDTGLAELRAAIERATGMAMKPNFTADVVKLSGHMSADERYERDKLLLETLGDDAKGKNFDEWRDAFVKAGGEETHSSAFEKHRHRLAEAFSIERVTGLRGLGREPRYRVKDIEINLFLLSSKLRK